ncbi:MAG: hypothetical protein J0I34_01245 [Pseudonocardia sp.]|uniref:hypothetical protein n=1 Tax=unclassified Pseudonocardia TaxID=2619320 RepID=UPI0008696D9A|nr:MULTISPECIES: hypothetical protein [unclassified Pseudonocardia]MBN9107381.1 hypothetical protein [Pseudonocardia sp.]ODU26652.1 MAG: hypothetical protein ABS80_06510 [Pseudonocardia sp. SCN 72-51]ODV06617.1 MAG: hypothetical protein ABT15_12420 [Pseudonocardia sp. SCN 73-27]
MGRRISDIAFEEQHSLDDVRAAVAELVADPRTAPDAVVADPGTDRDRVETASGIYADQQLTDAGDKAVTEMLSRLHSGGGTPDHPGA